MLISMLDDNTSTREVRVTTIRASVDLVRQGSPVMTPFGDVMGPI